MEIEEYDGHFIYRPKKYPGPIAINCKPSEACKEYHKNAKIQINISDELKESLHIDK